MHDFLRILLILGVAGSAMTMIGSGLGWWFEEERRLRRLVRRSLGGEPDGVIVARGRNAAAGFRLASAQVVVMREGGADALLYPLHALIGAELIVDDQVVARAVRDEPRRALDQIAASARRVTLRLVFDDARSPDFDLDLWLTRDQLRRDALPPSLAIEEARGWLARAEAILRRPAPASAPASTSAPPTARPEPPAETESPPWDEDDGDEDEAPLLL
jgi:hypothetical protein